MLKFVLKPNHTFTSCLVYVEATLMHVSFKPQLSKESDRKVSRLTP